MAEPFPWVRTLSKTLIFFCRVVFCRDTLDSTSVSKFKVVFKISDDILIDIQWDIF